MIYIYYHKPVLNLLWAIVPPRKRCCICLFMWIQYMYHHSEVIDLCVHDYKVDHCLRTFFNLTHAKLLSSILHIVCSNSRGVMVEIRNYL